MLNFEKLFKKSSKIMSKLSIKSFLYKDKSQIEKKGLNSFFSIGEGG